MLNKLYIIVILIFCISDIYSQCLSAASPVGGTDNLLVLEKKSLRFISFYKRATTIKYFENSKPSDFNLINKANYNFLSGSIGYGLTNRLTFESEFGYYINKTQEYNTTPPLKLKGSGLSNLNLWTKYNFFANHQNRVYFSVGLGAKIPFSRYPKTSENVVLPFELQPSAGCFGFLLNTSFVKEDTGPGMRYFITCRAEYSLENINDYKLGSSLTTSLFVSKHLMFNWLPGDWTTIFQVRNEIRWPDYVSGKKKEASGSYIFIIAPQINYVLKEKWNFSIIADIPVYQYFNGIQLSSGRALTIVASRTIKL